MKEKMTRIRRLIKLFPIHRMRPIKLDVHWIRQEGAIDAVYEMRLQYWEDHILPHGGNLALLSRPYKLSILTEILMPFHYWRPRRRYLDVGDAYRAAVKHLDKREK